MAAPGDVTSVLMTSPSNTRLLLQAPLPSAATPPACWPPAPPLLLGKREDSAGFRPPFMSVSRRSSMRRSTRPCILEWCAVPMSVSGDEVPPLPSSTMPSAQAAASATASRVSQPSPAPGAGWWPVVPVPTDGTVRDSSASRNSVIRRWPEPQCSRPRPIKAEVCTNGEISISQCCAGSSAGKCRHRVRDISGSAEPILEAAAPMRMEMVVGSWPCVR
mmetsp:Transcript_26045/g.35891  ORF Transcript_26045/g.35891 Transcript_26045/m.35891 type:complete len:218 (-) Transcript_26045:1132-1785(-)